MFNAYEYDYLDLCARILRDGEHIENKRTGKTCITLPSADFVYTPENIPLLTVKQSYPVGAWAERLGYFRRYEWANQFERVGTKTWYQNANENKDWLENPNRLGENHLGRIYGAATEPWEIPNLLSDIQNHKDDRGLVLNFWRPHLFEEGCLRPCLYDTVYTIVDGTLHSKSKQRSCDVPLGKNYNALSLWIDLKILSEVSGLKMGNASHSISNVHIYEDQVEGVKKMLDREPLDIDPVFKVNPSITNTSDILNENLHARDYFTLTGYEHLGKIDIPMSA